MTKLLFACAFVFAAAPAAAADTHDPSERDRDSLGWYVPDYARLQTGGWSGRVGVGLGYSVFNDVVNVGADYGYTPASEAGRNVHSLTANLTIRPLDFRLRDVRFVPLYFGANALFGFGDGYWVRLPERYRDISSSYYPPTGLHWMAHVGVEIDWLPREGAFERHGFYWEVRTLDTYFWAYFDNRAEVHPTDALASAIGYRAAF